MFCFAAFCVICIVTAVVSIQLLRLGLVNQTTDGQTFAKQDKDILVIISIGISSAECLLDLICLLAAWRFGTAVKNDVFKKREGTFHVQVFGGKDIIVIQNPTASSSGGNDDDKDRLISKSATSSEDLVTPIE